MIELQGEMKMRKELVDVGHTWLFYTPGMHRILVRHRLLSQMRVIQAALNIEADQTAYGAIEYQIANEEGGQWPPIWPHINLPLNEPF